jgi:threonine aldolase
VPSYGGDPITARLTAQAAAVFETDVTIFPVATGTAANALALASLVPPYGAVIAYDLAHIVTDECGAPEFFTGGAKLSLIGGAGAKVAATDLIERLAWFEPHVHGVQPRMLSITQATERGAIYRTSRMGAA